VMALAGATRGVLISPFSGKFSPMHLFPHAFGFALYLICSVMVYGADHKGAWLFQLAPSGAFRGFARGVYARLLSFVILPHIALLLVLSWYWGLLDASLFAAYSASAGAVYLSLTLRAVEGVPFSKQPETVTNPFVFAIMILGGMGIAVAVGFQFLIFHWPAAVLGSTLVLCLAAWLLTRSALDSLEQSIQFQMATLSAATKKIYQEIN
jgi:hypothetical protein